MFNFFRVRKQVVNIPSFIVRLDSQKHIEFSLQSPFGGGRPGIYSICIMFCDEITCNFLPFTRMIII